MARSKLNGLMGVLWTLLASCTPAPVETSPELSPEPSAIPTSAPELSDEDAAPQVPDAASHTAPAPPGERNRPHADARFTAFSKEATERCTPEGEPQGTGSIAAHERASVHCLEEFIEKQLTRLPQAAGEALSVGETIAESPEVWSPSWQRLVYASCGLDDHYAWHLGVQRVAGSMRYITSAGCPNGPTLEMGYWLQAMADGDADAIVTRLRDTAPFGQVRLAAIASAERMRAKAPEDSLFNEECWNCTLADMDWRRVLQRLHTFEQETRRLSEAMCGAWPQLADRLGRARCASEMRRHLASILAPLPRPFETDDDEATLREQPPAKDADYARFISPLIDECRPNESLRYSNNQYEQRYLACMKQRFDTQSKALLDGELLARWRSHTHALGGAEQRVVEARLSLSYQRVTPYWRNGVASLQCPGLAYARGLFWLSARRDNDAAAFARHVRRRLPWAERVRRGIIRARAYLSAPACAEEGDQWNRLCRPVSLDAQASARLRGSLALIERTAPRLAETSCAQWPELAAELNDQAECKRVMTAFYLSQSHYLGLTAASP